jgi:hypothetical protein
LSKVACVAPQPIFEARRAEFEAVVRGTTLATMSLDDRFHESCHNPPPRDAPSLPIIPHACSSSIPDFDLEWHRYRS